MANMIGEVNLLAVAFPDLTIGLQVTAVKYKNGSVIIKLSDQFDDQLLLPESVLSEVSPRFAARFRCTGLAGGRDVTDPSTGEKITVFEYHLAYCDKTFVLTDEGDTAESLPKPTTYRGLGGVTRSFGPWAYAFQNSTLADEYWGSIPNRYARSHSGELPEVRKKSILAHKLAFAILLQPSFDPALYIERDADIIFNLVEVAALAEYYDFLPSIAPRLVTLLEEVSGLWKSIAGHPIYFLRLSVKLRSENIFAEALRHVVGQKSAASQYRLGRIPYEAAEAVMNQSTSLFCRQDALKHELGTLTLFKYVFNKDKSLNKGRAAPVRTTWMGTNEEAKDLEGKCHYLAKQIFKETLDALMYGETHLSHFVEVADGSGKLGGEVRAGSLRIACEAILDAEKKNDLFIIFGRFVQYNYTKIFKLPPKAAGMIASRLRFLVRKAAEAIRHRFPTKEDLAKEALEEEASMKKGLEDESIVEENLDEEDREEENREEEHPEDDLEGSDSGDRASEKYRYPIYSRAHADEGLEYFTNMAIEEEDIPWVREAEWAKVQLPELEGASEEWLRVVGLSGK